MIHLRGAPGGGQSPGRGRCLDFLPPLGLRPVSNLIDTPNWFSFVVAVLAGVVGVVSLAFGSGSEAWGSVLQLLLNVAVLTAVAIAGLPAQRAIWQRTARRASMSDMQKTGG